MGRVSLASSVMLALLVSAPLLAVAADSAAPLAVGTIAKVAGDTGGHVNVRTQPSVAEGVVTGKLDAGDTVTVEEVGGTLARPWYRIVAPTGEAGWVFGTLLQAATDAGTTAEPEDQTPDQPASPDTGSTVAATPPAAPAADAAAAAPPAPAPAASGTAAAKSAATPSAGGAAPTTPVKPEAAPIPNDWTHMVAKLMPAINSCGQVLAANPLVVTRLYILEPNLAGVRLADNTGRRWECLILQSGGYPIRYEPIAPGQRPLPGDGNPMFIVAPGTPQNDSCHRSDDLHDPKTGVLLGWRVQVLC
jgi:hypothetical protein